MIITVDAIYESGILRPLSPLPQFEERARVRITVETSTTPTVDQFSNQVQIDPAIAREIIESPEFSSLES